MKNNRKRSLSILLIFVMTISLLLSGCGSKKESDKQQIDSDVSFTKSQYIAMIGNEFGLNEYVGTSDYFTDVTSSNENYNFIQACAEWDVIEAGGKFEPESELKLGDAIEMAVKAIGVDRIEKSGEKISNDSLVDFFTANIAEVDTSNLDVAVDEMLASEIIRASTRYNNSIEMPNICEIDLNSNVNKATQDIVLNYDGQTGSFNNDAKYEVGDIIYWEPTDTTMAKGIKITSVDGNVFKYTDAEIDEVYENINISGTFDGKIMSATSASECTSVQYKQIYDDVTNYCVADNAEGCYAELCKNPDVKVDFTGDGATFSAHIEGSADGKYGEANGAIDFTAAVKNIKVTAKYEHGWILIDPKAFYSDVTFDTEVTTNFTGSVSTSIPLGEIEVYVMGPIFLELSLVANIGADGELTLSYTTNNCLHTEWKKGCGFKKVFNSDPSLTYDAQLTVTAEATALADIRIGWGKISYSIINAEITSGAVAIAKAEGSLLSKDVHCIDVLIYVPLRWGINQRNCLLTKVSSNLKHSEVVWDSTNSKVKAHFHFEDMKRTPDDKCTKTGEEEVIQEEEDERGDPFDELEIFDFEPMEFEFIELENSLIFLKENETDSLGFKELPKGYTESDLVYESKDSNICSVSNGKIKATGTGSTTIIVKTKDGEYTAVVAVTIFPDYTVDDFVPLV